MLNDSMTEAYITRAGRAHFARRREKLAGLNSAQGVAARQAEIRAIVGELVGPLPKRTPLQVNSIATLRRDGYDVELLTYQSVPGVITTANLYRPQNRPGPVPGVVCIPGSWPEGKVHAEFQRLGQLLSRRGIAALLVDMPGQGERVEFYDATLRRSWLGASVQCEQTHLGNMLALMGQSVAGWIVWDAMRAVDVLIEHAGADPKRLGVTAAPGGGTYKRLLCCLEERLSAAVVVASHYTLEDLGGEHAGRSLLGAVARGLTASDFLVPFAPRPLLLACCAGEKCADDMNATAGELQRYYRLLGAPDKIGTFVADGPQGYLKDLRTRCAEHFGQVFGVADQRAREPASPTEKPELLYCTETGQVSNSLNSGSIVVFNKESAATLPPQLPVPRDDAGAAALQQEIRSRIVPYLRLPETASPIESEVESRSSDWGFSVERGRLVIEEGLYVPYSFYTLPEGAEPPAGRSSAGTLLALHDRGIAAISAEGPWMEAFAAAGLRVMAIDVSGTGETRLQAQNEDHGGYEALLCGPEAVWARRALNVGLSLFGLRVFNVLRTVAYLRTRWDIGPTPISIVGVGRGGLWAMYAAALDREIKRVVTVRTLETYKSIILRRRHNHHFSLFLPGCLREFDLPHVAACIAPRPLTIINAVNGRKERSLVPDVQGDYALTSEMYKLRGAPQSFRVANADSAPGTVAELMKTIAQ